MANIRSNSAEVGDIFPMVITKTWGDQPNSAVNGTVMLDGMDTHWATSVGAGDDVGQFTYRD